MNFIFENESPEVKQTLHEEWANVQVTHERYMIDNAFRHKYRMNVEEMRQLQECFDNRYVLPDKPNKDSSHPILAVLNDYANHCASNYISASRSKGVNVMSIGDAAHSPLGARHNCLLVNSTREMHRISNNGKATGQLKTFCVGETTFPACCVEGAQNCRYQADEAVAVHSMYDVTMVDLCHIFAKHGLRRLTAYMHMSTRLYDEDLIDPYPFFKVELGKKFVTFSMHDNSIPYVHNRSTYTAWATTSVVRSNDFDLVFEHSRNHGPMHTIIVTRVDKIDKCCVSRLIDHMLDETELSNDRIQMTIPLGKIFKNAYRVPDIFQAFKNKFLYDQKHMRHYVVPANIVIALFAYANRAADEGYKFHELATYSSGLRRRIVIGGTTYQTSWDCGYNEYNRVIFSIFVLGAVARTDRTKGISAVFNHLKSTGMEVSFLGSLYRKFLRFFHTKKDMSIETAGDYLWEYRALPIVDINVCNIITTGNEIEKIRPVDNFTEYYAPSSSDSDHQKPELFESELPPVTPTAPPEAHADDAATATVVPPSTPRSTSSGSSEAFYYEMELEASGDYMRVVGDDFTAPVYDQKTYKGRIRNECSKFATEYKEDKLEYERCFVLENPSNVVSLYCVSEDLTLDDDTSERFKERFGNVDTMRRLKRKVGDVIGIRDEGRTAIAMITKRTSKEKPFYINIAKCLQSAYEYLLYRNIDKVAMPKICCGYDSMNWQVIAGMVTHFLVNNGISVKVCDPKLKSQNKQTTPKRDGIIANKIKNISSLNINNSDENVQIFSQPQHVDVPDTYDFLVGHCAMRAFYEVAGLKINKEAYLEVCRGLLLRSHVLGTYYTEKEVEEYIYAGNFDNGCSANIIALLSAHYAVPIVLNIDGILNKHLQANEDEKLNALDITKAKVIYYSGRHYSSQQGGKVAKFDKLVDDLEVKGKTVLDLSAAPGYLSDKLLKAGALLDIGVYANKDIQYKFQHDHIVYNNFPELLDAVEGKRYDIIICDAARKVNSEEIIYEAANHFIPLLKEGGQYVSKTFGNPHKLWEYGILFKGVEKLQMDTSGSESYYRFSGYLQGSTDFNTCYDQWNSRETQHAAYTTDSNRFVREFFQGPYKDFAPTINKEQSATFEFTAITGYASSAKTTKTAEDYKRAVWIAPTQTLSLRHMKLGVPSFTPHVFFQKEKDQFDTIIIDEISQFPIDYISLIANVFPKHKIIVLGDIYQTRYVNFMNKRKLSTVKDVGVINNIIDVFKIPQDIAEMINDKHGFNIRSSSAVKEALAFCKESIKKLAHTGIPVIVFNSASCKELLSQGIKAHTITTYTGSRDHTVVLYIDSAAISSKLLNRTEQLYTAVTRATDRLVIMGDTDYISKYYNIHGSKLMTYEEISEAYVYHMSRQNDDNSVPITCPKETVSLPVSDVVAQSIVEEIIKPVNDVDNTNYSTSKLDIPAVQQGYANLPTDMVVDHPQEVVGYKVGYHKLAKQQTSTNSIETVQTLFSRYSKKYAVKLDERNSKYTFTELMNGLSMAVYGNKNSIRKLERQMHTTIEEVTDNQLHYLDKLQEKINHCPGAAKELQDEIDMTREDLKFFNKRQTKFDSAVGFDMKDKVGQGVASFSKKINALYSAYARTMLDKMKQILQENGGKILLATHDSEAALNDTYTNIINRFKCNNWTCNDFSEWDASFRTPFTKLTSYLLKCMGAPEVLIDNFETYRKSWSMTYQNKIGRATLKGYEKQFSGNPFTICENTIGNMALCFAIFDYKNFKFAMFKGDDSAVLCDNSKLNKKGREIINITGHGLKMHNSPVGEFAGWFLTDVGMFPDVIRYTCKFLDKTYRDEEHFREAQMSLQERCSAVKTETQVRAGSAACHYYYNEIFGGNSISTEDITNLYYFLLCSRNIKFDSLRPVKLPIVHV